MGPYMAQQAEKMLEILPFDWRAVQPSYYKVWAQDMMDYAREHSNESTDLIATVMKNTKEFQSNFTTYVNEHPDEMEEMIPFMEHMKQIQGNLTEYTKEYAKKHPEEVKALGSYAVKQAKDFQRTLLEMAGLKSEKEKEKSEATRMGFGIVISLACLVAGLLM
eukprot:gnl/TRDRNA2_/TRDRNA2_163629_c0_seq1.p1 gnl/TRDRNA2_/TRDRNA2_163629_c0~~gnl/TRDRNA2_/TRDRNA2_163629_c0_seq1.p1  ORF type:complete len:171 (+),score=47.59 gnl/TRDRNA2_/TRDRNA2_163629_c0_seq1:26-514(+)